MSFEQGNPTIFDQSIWDISDTAKHLLGTVRDLGDGRKFVYAKAGATALAAGKLNQQEAVLSTSINLDVTATTGPAAIGEFVFGVTTGAAVIAENAYAGGYVWHNKTGVLGQMYKIDSHLANAGSVELRVNLKEPLRVAVADADEFSLVKHPQKDLIISPTTLTAAPTGVAPVAVTAEYYFWNQVTGPCACLAHGTLVVGDNVTPSMANTPIAGAVEASTEAVSIGVIVGSVSSIGTTAETAFIMLAIPGY
jgi:hypothetical protein